MDVTVKTLSGEDAGTVTLPDDVFALEPRADILQRVVRWQLAKRQAGTHGAKGRGKVSGTGRKMYKQKGTGRARHSDRKAPHFRGGGKAHGPVVRSHAHDLPKKVRALGLRHALSAKARDEAIVVLDAARSEDGKTGTLRKQLEALGLRNALVVDGPDIDGLFGRALRNIPEIDALPVRGLNVYDVLRRRTLVLTRSAVEGIEERLK